jgi:AICAR transformylase/IMP cyclohydrolase PurH
LELLENNSCRLLTTKHGWHTVQLLIKDASRLLDIDQYNGVFDSEFGAFGQAIFVGTMYKKFDATDYAALESNKIKKPIDLVVVNFGDKKFQDLNRDEQASLFLLQAAINNFGRVMVITDPADYFSFIEYMKRDDYYCREGNIPKPVAGMTDIKTRFSFAQKAAEYIANIFSDFESSSFEDQKWELLQAKIETSKA